MGKKASKSKKSGSSGKARRLASRRHKLIRLGLIYLCIIILCIGILAAMSIISRSTGRDSWRTGSDRALAPEVQADAGGLSVERKSGAPQQESLGADVPTQAPTRQPTPEPTPEATPEPTPEPTPEVTPEPSEVTITITAAGDCTLGGSVHQDTYERFKSVVQSQGYDYFFDNVRQFFAADDLTILNLEGPITDTGKARRGSYCFKGDPDFVNIMTGSSVELCNVANNHSIDFGVAGLKRTAELLEYAGIGCCGYTKVYHGTVKGVRITALGFDKWQNNREGIEQVIRQERPNCDLLIVNMHWGREKVYEPMKQQVEWGHAAIDAGADLVIGTHPHVYGGVELYNGKYIAYSLGNFCFGGNGNPSDKRWLIFQQTFVVRQGQVSDGGINIIPCMVSSVSNKNDFKPTPMAAEAGASLLKAIALYSNLNRDTRWMRNSYPEQIGLMQAQTATSEILGQAVNVFQTVPAQPTPVPENTPLPAVTAAPTMIPGQTAQTFATMIPGQTVATQAPQAQLPDIAVEGFDFGNIQESVYDDDEARVAESQADAITADQVQAGAVFTKEQLRESELSAKEALYMDQMQN